MAYMKKLILATSLFSIALTLSCSKSETEYWWTRGQPPAPSALADKMQTRLEAAEELGSQSRSPLKSISKDIRQSLAAISKDLLKQSVDPSIREHLSQAEQLFLQLDGKLTYPSRPAYGELAGQLRSYSDKLDRNEQISREAFELFVARTFSFLADELEVASKLEG